MTARIVPIDGSPLYSGLRSAGGGSSIEVHAWCQCGWTGPVSRCRRDLLPDGLRRDLEADRARHEEATGHASDPQVAPEGRHDFGCGFYHRLNDACPKLVDSPGGRLARVLGASTSDPCRALDRLSATDELRNWLGETEVEAVIGARLARCTWAEIGAAIGISKAAAWNRWGQMISRYEQAGIIDEVPEVSAATTS